MKQETPIASALQSIVDAGALAGAVTLIWRPGQVSQVECVGWRNVATKTPMARDTLFRIASMTKPITSLAALMLWEEGRFALDDPISRWAPEFTDMRVLRERTGSLAQTVPAQRPITLEDLLTHRAGFSYADFEQGPIAQAYAEALGGNIDNDYAPADWMARLAALPLIDQPGAAFHYGHATDLLGLLIARMEDTPLGDVFARRIFEPLGMKDTGFTVAQAKRSRCAALHGFDEAGQLTILPHAGQPCAARAAGGHGLCLRRPGPLVDSG
ncbi:MAG: serine hydrolase domain-containing protein [Caldilineaceae bacterium]